MTIIYVPLSSARQNKESEKGLFNTNKQKTNTRTYVNQRDDMLTKTRNLTTTEYTLMHNKYIITFVGNATIMPHECEKWYN